ncbi:hypothetical protein [Paenibacillus sp.]|jgi:hypothetical protein|uniref:hypothetical protein n=1 Tax=Paenibacillus sp. TaxID=58172 RepID=UPI002832B24D|nr:hypothetical protein [Paenibacillus sp.]MDR0271188.1 hypothetical protein [Paenibacillus sp.]
MIFLLILSVLLVGCGKSKSDDSIIIEKAKQIGIEYFKKNYNIDVVFTEFKVMPSYIDSMVTMHGHVQGAETETIYLMVNYRTYEIDQVYVFDDFDKKYPKIEGGDGDPSLKDKHKD